MFKYFPSKEALYRAIIQKRTDGSEEMFFPKEAIQAKDDRQVFRSIASYLISKNTDDPTFMRLIQYSALEGHELSRIFFESHAMEKTRLLPIYPPADQGKGVSKSPSLSGRPGLYRHDPSLRPVAGNLRIEGSFSFFPEKGRGYFCGNFLEWTDGKG